MFTNFKFYILANSHVQCVDYNFVYNFQIVTNRFGGFTVDFDVYTVAYILKKLKMKRKLNVLSVHVKLAILERLNKGEGAEKLAAEFNVGTSSISDWKKQREALDREAQNMTIQEQKKRKTLKKSYFEDVDEVTFMWFMQRRNRGMPITGPMIQFKAREFFKKMYGAIKEKLESFLRD